MNERPRLLIVDDERGVRESLRAILQGECEVLTASSGDEAIAIVGREPVDVVTLDLKMPGLGGIGVLERIKEIDPDIEVLIITGYGTIDTAVQGLRFRAFDYISKPFDCDHVRQLVQSALARRAAARRMKSLPDQILSSLSHELRQALDVAPVRLSDMLGKLRSNLAPGATGKDVMVRLDVSTGLVLATDEDKLTRLLRALLDNAVQHTPQGHVVVTARPASGGATLEIRDSGPGITPELIVETEDVIAGRTSMRPPRHLGFGLRLAGRLVRTLGASLTLVGGPDGTTCHLVIPDLAAADAPHVAYGG